MFATNFWQLPTGFVLSVLFQAWQEKNAPRQRQQRQAAIASTLASVKESGGPSRVWAFWSRFKISALQVFCMATFLHSLKK